MSASIAAAGLSPRWFIYLVRTGAGSLYAGISTDPERRLRQHQSGKGARALRGKGPLTLAWQQAVGSGDKNAAADQVRRRRTLHQDAAATDRTEL